MNDRGLHDLSQDTVGFGRAEWNTIRDSVLRPRQLLEAYMTAGPDGGGEYARPLKLYLLLCGILMLVLPGQGLLTILIALMASTFAIYGRGNSL